MKHRLISALDFALVLVRLLFGGAPRHLGTRIEYVARQAELRLTLPQDIDGAEANRVLALAEAAHEQGKALAMRDIQCLVPDLSLIGATHLLRLVCEAHPGAWTVTEMLPLGEGRYAPAVIVPTEAAEEGQGG